jgi:hypothetical protein
MGFRCLHAPRIAYGEIIKVERDQWASDDLHDAGTRQQRQSDFLRHFQDFSYQALKSFGIQLLTLHSLTPLPSNWRNGLVAEEQTPRMFASKEFFLADVRNKLADWADFDMAAAHYAYGYDLLCTEDKGKPRSNSIFSPTYAPDMKNRFHVEVVDLMELAKRCWRQFGLPIRKWR